MFKLIFIICIEFLFLRTNIKRKNGWKNPSSILLLIYFFAAVFSIFHLIINGDSSVVKYTMVLRGEYWPATFMYLLFISLFLFPIYQFKEDRIVEIRLPNIQILNLFSGIVISLSLLSIVYYLPSLINMFRSGTALSTLRNNMNVIRDDYVNIGSFFNTTASVASSLYPFALMLFFIYYIMGNHPIQCMLLLISSTSNIIHVLTFMGRDGIVFWIFMFVFMYYVFGRYLNMKQRKKVRSLLIIGTIIAIIPFAAISISRFGSSSNNYATTKGLLSYMGQMIPNYLLYFNVRETHYNFGESFPLYWEITNQKKPDSVRWIDGGTESNVFGTFIKSYITNFGVIGTIIIGVILAIIFLRIFRKGMKKLYLHHYFVYVLYFQLLSEGVFYFREYTRGGNLYIVICIFCFFIFKVVEKIFGTFLLVKNEE